MEISLILYFQTNFKVFALAPPRGNLGGDAEYRVPPH